jgi:hypothetical protein
VSTSTAASPQPETVSAEKTSAGGITWAATNAVRSLRLALADAGLQARVETRKLPRGSHMYDEARGRTRGLEDAVSLLRRWSHPDRGEQVLRALQMLAQRARVRADADSGTATAVYDAAYAWTIAWVLDAVRERWAENEAACEPAASATAP